jgi:L-amino acid N-acyltransferase YncA
MEYTIDKMTSGDWEQVRLIYLEGIATGHSTFEADAPDWEKWHSGHLAEPRLVAKAGERVMGWAGLLERA